MREYLALIATRIGWTVAYLRNPQQGPQWRARNRKSPGITGALVAALVAGAVAAGTGSGDDTHGGSGAGHEMARPAIAQPSELPVSGH